MPCGHFSQARRFPSLSSAQTPPNVPSATVREGLGVSRWSACDVLIAAVVIPQEGERSCAPFWAGSRARVAHPSSTLALPGPVPRYPAAMALGVAPGGQPSLQTRGWVLLEIKPNHGVLFVTTALPRSGRRSVADDHQPSKRYKSAFWACMRFSAWSKTRLHGPSMTPAVTSWPLCAGRQCRKTASSAARPISSSSTW